MADSATNPTQPTPSTLTTAIISDVHGNAEALKAVLADIDSRKVTRILSLDMRITSVKYDGDNMKGVLTGQFTFEGGTPTLT